LCDRKIQLDTRKHRHHTCKGQVLHAAVLAVQARCVAQPGASCGGRFVLPVPRRRANHHTLPRRPRPGPSRGDRLPPEPPPQSACRQRGSCLRTSHTVFISVLRCASSGATLAVTKRHVHVCLHLSHLSVEFRVHTFFVILVPSGRAMRSRNLHVAVDKTHWHHASLSNAKAKPAFRNQTPRLDAAYVCKGPLLFWSPLQHLNKSR
jgi:hypothetical protein